MYFASYLYKDNEDYGILNTEKTKIIPMKELLKQINKEVPRNLLDFISVYSDSLIPSLESIIAENEDSGIPLENIKLTAPIPYPNRNIICLGKNYEDHALEIKSLPGGKAAVPDFPIYFTKAANPAIGHMDKVVIPTHVTNEVDYEVELAIIIGKDGKNIAPQEAEDYIFGYTIVNDISARDIQMKHSQWFRGKSLDTFTPMGPYLVYKSEIDYPVNLDVSCKVNGEIRQSSNTDKLIFDIPYIISDLSNGFTLKAGDIILTGTPAGVGMGFNPPRFLKSGDVVECSIEKIGTLVNYIK